MYSKRLKELWFIFFSISILNGSICRSGSIYLTVGSGYSGVGGETLLMAGSSTSRTGGEINIHSGDGYSSSSGQIQLRTINAGQNGISASLSFSSGTTSDGNAGDIMIIIVTISINIDDDGDDDDNNDDDNKKKKHK